MSLDALIARFWAWIDQVAGLLLHLAARLRGARRAEIVEAADGTFALAGGAAPVPFRLDDEAAALPPEIAADLKGRDVALLLRPERFLFRPLELPERAGDFLSGIVRAQIDRLTPWAAEEAAFGWSAPSPAGDGRIVVTVAATAQARIAALAAPLAAAGARAVTIATRPAGEEAPIAVLAHAGARPRGAVRLRQALAGMLAVALIAALGTALAAEFAGADLDARSADLERRIAVQRRLLTTGTGGESGATAPLKALERRKQESPSTVIVLDWLSRALPDDTYVTELHVERDRVQVIGLSQDAPALIRLLEQSRRFTEATFFAPTTRAGGEAGERFHIEARIRSALEAGQ